MAAALLPEIRWRAIDENGDVIPFALLYAWTVGTSTPASTFSDSALTTANTQPQVADAGGLFGPIYLSPTGYKFGLYPANPSPPVVPVDDAYWTQDQVGDPGALFASTFGTTMAVGSRNVTSGYTQLATDRLVTVASSGATTFNLLAASSCTMDLTIKNMLTGTVVVRCNGADLIDGIAGSPSQFIIEAAADPVYPAITIRPITGGWLIVSSHRAA